MSPILTIETLCVETERTDAKKLLVDGVSLTLHPGEVLGLIGESGAGKTTIGLAALGYARPGSRISGGRILYRGNDISRAPEDGLRRIRGQRIAYVAQSAANSFNPAMRLGRQVCEPLVRHGVAGWSQARNRSAALFGELSLPSPQSFGQSYPHQVSGGQLQRAMAAMAMSCGPDILVLDEPTTALDVTTQIEVLAALRNLIRRHAAAALYISHDLAVVAQIADRILVLRHGKAVEEGPTEQILNRPRQDYTRALLAVRAGDSTLRGKPPLAAGTAAPLLALERVSASYATHMKAVDDISFAVRRGETVAVVGESGSGKTSIARSVCGLLPPTTGAIRFQGAVLPGRLADRKPDQLRRIQMIYQMPDVALNPRHTVAKLIGRPVELYADGQAVDVRKRVTELLGMVDLPADLIDRTPGQLSGGQKQRVCIARALAAKPDLLICDEITSALDPLVAEEVLDLLQKLQAEMGLGIVMITHDLGLVRKAAHRVVVMLQGRMVAAGPVDQVFSPPYHSYTQLLLSSVPEMRLGWLDAILAKRAARPGGAEKCRGDPCQTSDRAGRMGGNVS